MNSGHWSDEELIHRMYGVGQEEEARVSHLQECQECSAKWLALEQRRGLFVESAQTVTLRLEEARRPWLWRMAPAGATALLLLFALVLHRPAPQPVPQEIAAYQQISDEQLFSEIASMVDETAPRVAKPMQGLFEAGAEVEVQ